ncbi:MAG: type II secretion system protein [Planctomycetota bacterium]
MRARRGFTFLELLIAVAVIAGLVGIMLPALGKSRAMARQIKDSAQIRGCGQGLVLFAQNNQDVYPLPSLIDKGDLTIRLAAGEDAGLKDQTKNIFSILVFGAFFGPEICVSTAESNGDIVTDLNYEYSEPKAAMGRDKKLAIWDPAFKGPPSAGYQGCNAKDPGNVSYAHSMPFGGRKKSWSSTFVATEVILGNRGAWYELQGGASGTWKLSGEVPKDAMHYPQGARPATVSNTLLIHGGRTTWEGNIAYNDNHVNFETRPDPETSPFTFASLDPAHRTMFDNLFANENDKARSPDADSLAGGDGPDKNVNNYLRMYAGGKAAGGTMVDLKGAWFAD